MTPVRTAFHDTFKSLRVRNFRLFFTGQLISQVGNWLTLVAQTLLVLQLTDNGIALGALAAAQFGPVLLLGPWAGLVADRSDKRRLLLIVQTIAMLQSFTLAVLGVQPQPAGARGLRRRARSAGRRPRSTIRPGARSSSRWFRKTT